MELFNDREIINNSLTYDISIRMKDMKDFTIKRIQVNFHERPKSHHGFVFPSMHKPFIFNHLIFILSQKEEPITVNIKKREYYPVAFTQNVQ